MKLELQFDAMTIFSVVIEGLLMKKTIVRSESERKVHLFIRKDLFTAQAEQLDLSSIEL